MFFAACPSVFVPGHRPYLADGGEVSPRRRGWLRRLYDRLIESRQKQAERLVVAYLERSGGRFTDDIERQLTERLCSGGGFRQ
jgi:hypothetical protein